MSSQAESAAKLILEASFTLEGSYTRLCLTSQLWGLDSFGGLLGSVEGVVYSDCLWFKLWEIGALLRVRLQGWGRLGEALAQHEDVPLFVFGGIDGEDVEVEVVRPPPEILGGARGPCT